VVVLARLIDSMVWNWMWIVCLVSMVEGLRESTENVWAGID
jgi:hypothetical protein